MSNAEQTRRTVSRWPQVTLRELLYLMTFFAVLYGFDIMRGDRESLMADVVRTPLLLAVFLLWRILHHCRGVQDVLARVFINATLGAAIGTMATVLVRVLHFMQLGLPSFPGVPEFFWNPARRAQAQKFVVVD